MNARIQFSTNVTLEREATCKVINWLKNTMSSLGNRLFLKKKVVLIMDKYSIFDDKWSISKIYGGHYDASTDTTISDNTSVSIDNVPDYLMEKICQDFCTEFNQQSVYIAPI